VRTARPLLDGASRYGVSIDLHTSRSASAVAPASRRWRVGPDLRDLVVAGAFLNSRLTHGAGPVTGDMTTGVYLARAQNGTWYDNVAHVNCRMDPPIPSPRRAQAGRPPAAASARRSTGKERILTCCPAPGQ
jgi:hypothetical protein